MLHNSSYDFSYELIPSGGSMCVRLVEARVNQSDNRGQITQIRFDGAPFRATVCPVSFRSNEHLRTVAEFGVGSSALSSAIIEFT